jgi:hypothetical protein
LGYVAEFVWIEGLNLCRELDVKYCAGLDFLHFEYIRHEWKGTDRFLGPETGIRGDGRPYLRCVFRRPHVMSHLRRYRLWVHTPPHFHRSSTMSSGYHNRKGPICSKIRSLLLPWKEPSKYDQIAPKIEYWIEYVLREDFATVDELVEGVSDVAWDYSGSYADVGRFLKEFRDAPHRSEQARSFVDQLCSHVLRWFAIASVEDLRADSDARVRGFNGGGLAS